MLLINYTQFLDQQNQFDFLAEHLFYLWLFNFHNTSFILLSVVERIIQFL